MVFHGGFFCQIIPFQIIIPDSLIVTLLRTGQPEFGDCVSIRKTACLSFLTLRLSFWAERRISSFGLRINSVKNLMILINRKAEILRLTPQN